MDYSSINKTTYNSITESWNKTRKNYWKIVYLFLDENHEKEKLKLLDLGCGTGRHMILAEDIGFLQENIIGADFSENNINEIHKKQMNGIIMNFEQPFPFEINSFDIILFIAAFHHIIDRKKQIECLQELYRVLKTDGKVLLSVWMPQKEYIVKQLLKNKMVYVTGKIVKIEYQEHERFYYFFDENEIIDIITSIGFKIIKTTHDDGNFYLYLTA